MGGGRVVLPNEGGKEAVEMEQRKFWKVKNEVSQELGRNETQSQAWPSERRPHCFPVC